MKVVRSAEDFRGDSVGVSIRAARYSTRGSNASLRGATQPALGVGGHRALVAGERRRQRRAARSDETLDRATEGRERQRARRRPIATAYGGYGSASRSSASDSSARPRLRIVDASWIVHWARSSSGRPERQCLAVERLGLELQPRRVTRPSALEKRQRRVGGRPLPARRSHPSRPDRRARPPEPIRHPPALATSSCANSAAKRTRQYARHPAGRFIHEPQDRSPTPWPKRHSSRASSIDCSKSASSGSGQRCATTTRTRSPRSFCCSPPMTTRRTSSSTSTAPAARSPPAWRSTTPCSSCRTTSSPSASAWPPRWASCC